MPSPPALPCIDQGTFIVERVIGSRVEDGVVKYKVLWQGYPKSEATWEPRENFIGEGAVECIENYLKERKEKKKAKKVKVEEVDDSNFVVDSDEEEREERRQRKLKKEMRKLKAEKRRRSPEPERPKGKVPKKAYRVLSSGESESSSGSCTPELRLSDDDFVSSSPKKARVESCFDFAGRKKKTARIDEGPKKKKADDESPKKQKIDDDEKLRKKLARKERKKKAAEDRAANKPPSKPTQTPVGIIDDIMAMPFHAYRPPTPPADSKKKKTTPKPKSLHSSSFNKSQTSPSENRGLQPPPNVRLPGKPDSRRPYYDTTAKTRLIPLNNQFVAPSKPPTNYQQTFCRTVPPKQQFHNEPPKTDFAKSSNYVPLGSSQNNSRPRQEIGNSRCQKSGPPRVVPPVIPTTVDFDTFKRYVLDLDYSKISCLREIPRDFCERRLDEKNNTLLHRLVEKNTPEAAEILRLCVNQFKANINVKNLVDDSLLHVALRTVIVTPAGCFKNDMVFTVIALKGDPNAVNQMCEYPLFLAYKNNNADAAIRLIMYGANPAAVLQYERGLANQMCPFYVREKILKEFVQLDRRQLEFTFSPNNACIIPSSVYVEPLQRDKLYRYQVVLDNVDPHVVLNDIFIVDFGIILRQPNETKISLSRPMTSIVESVYINDVALSLRNKTCRLAFDATEVIRAYFKAGQTSFILSVTFSQSAPTGEMLSCIVRYSH